jgi:hypothetical protein
MHSDPTNQFRSQLEANPPEFISKVDTPWDEVPDYADFNADAYRQIKRDLERLSRVSRTGRPTSRGILVLGESGTGKTHLLMRVANNLAKTNHILFVRRPNNEESIAQHIWANIVSSLARKLPASGEARSQLDNLLAHVFSKVLIPEFEQDVKDGNNATKKQRWVELLKEDPYNLFEMLGEGENRTANMKQIRSRTLRYLQREHPEADQQIAHALISYCFVFGETRRRVLLSWLSGQDIDERESQAMNLPYSWVDLDDTSSDSSVQQRREEKALRAIQTIGILSTYYQPLILAFDQLEGLRYEEGLTRRWGDVVREIFTMSPNFLIVTCIYPSLWESWFLPQLDASSSQRISEQRIMLEQFKPIHGLRLLEKHLESIYTQHQLPTSIYPFTEEDVASLCSQASSPRLFIQQAKAAFDAWLNESIYPTSSTTCSSMLTTVNQENVERLLSNVVTKFEKEQRNSYATEITTEQDFFGRIRCIIQAILSDQSVEYDKATWSHYVIPPNFVARSRLYGDSLCIAVMNGDNRSFTSRIRNLVSVFRDGEQFTHAIIIRDCRCNQVSEKGKEYLQAFQRRKGNYLSVSIDEYTFLNALYDTLVAIEEQNLSIGTYKVTKCDFVQYLKYSGIGRQSQLFRTAAKMVTLCEQALKPHSDIGGKRSTSEPSALPPVPAEPIILAELSDESVNFMEELTDGEESTNVPAKSYDLTTTATLSESVAILDRPTQIIAGKVTKNVPSESIKEKHWMKSDISVLHCDCLIGDTELDSVHMGLLGELKSSHKKLGISLTKPQCIVLLGYMGSGKSYALGVLIENATLPSSPLIRSTRPMSVVAFNYRKNPEARFEYGGFAHPNNQQAEVQALAAKYKASPTGISAVNVFGYGPELKRRKSDFQGLPTYPIQFRPEELGAEHWSILMKPPSPQSEYMDVIRDIIQELYYQDRLTFRTLEKCILTDDRLSSSQRKQANNRIRFASRWLVDERSYEWKDMLKEGSLNIFDLRMQTLNSDEALKLCLVITDLVRKTRNGVNKMIVFDEAHEYVDSRELIGELENAITQIRHDGLSFVLASQFPERIPESIFKYLLTRIVFKLPTKKAINYLQKVAPNLKTLSIEEVVNLNLEQGLCFIQTDDDCTDKKLSKPQLLEIRPRCSLHGGATIRQI